MEKILSICVPVYNGGELAYQNIKEILTYRGEDIEVIVSNNASTDNTLELLQKIDDKRLKILTHKENIGPFLNWYYALMAGTAKYVMLHQDNDRIVVKNLPQYIEFLKQVQYDVIRNCYEFSGSKAINVVEVQYYNFIYSHASYVVYRREALHSIKPLKCSFDGNCTIYPYTLWDTQILKKYAINEKKAYLYGGTRITYAPRVRNIGSRTKVFASNGHPSYSYENITLKFINYMEALRLLYVKDREYYKLVCSAYRANIYWAVINYYVIMNKSEQKWMKKRYGLHRLDDGHVDYIGLNDDFYKRVVSNLNMHSPVYKTIAVIKMGLITMYNKILFLLDFYDGETKRK